MVFAIMMIAMAILAVAYAILILEVDMSWLTEPKRLKRKNKALQKRNKELENLLQISYKHNDKLQLELTARRNNLAWVNVEEINGTQE